MVPHHSQPSLLQPTLPTLVALLAAASSLPPRPVVIFDRHIEKNGGLSMSRSFEVSNCTYFGYRFGDAELRQIRDLLQNETAVDAEQTHICVNAHSPVAEDWLEQAHGLRDTAARPRVITTLRIRSPPDYYVSFFNWDQVPRQDAGYGEKLTVVEWMPGDLQSRILLDWENAIHGQHRELPQEPLNASMCAAALRIAGDVDLLTTTEQEDQMWPVLRKLSGLTLPTNHFSEPPKFFTPPSLLLADETVARATEQFAPCDWHLHRLAEVRTNSMLSEWAAFREKSD